jgi:hypothetical protein
MIPVVGYGKSMIITDVELSEKSLRELKLAKESIPTVERASSHYDLVEFTQKLPNGQNELRSNKCDICGRCCKNYQGMRVHRAACLKKYKVIFIKLLSKILLSSNFFNRWNNRIKLKRNKFLSFSFLITLKNHVLVFFPT